MKLPDHNFWYGREPLDHIEARQDLKDTVVENAVVILKDGFRAEGVRFYNVVFVCENEALADGITSIARLHGLGRVFVGGMPEAIRILAIAAKA